MQGLKLGAELLVFQFQLAVAALLLAQLLVASLEDVFVMALGALEIPWAA